ncbi:DNA polymerase III subunit gamma/tau [Sporosarcina gallistercoris]|uniref:DNA-directed DNA polymerase n=1 Tax=Sporosarcina gallistercoris TaxID=2762245 RepID=A0ABR8PN07_9BACL|nr:DNA polymerase III subunit gamma/tau [Sporosarcina gallistercoris]MBD7909552.1 DNA polymerase III subunit gamma/tau [Sporosarcina gallistercoris]
MSYQAFYRVYRPQTFHEMSGQQHVKQTLQNALLHNKTTHAYLFSGPRGTGKTSAAKIFAKALNCENGPAKEPCNECETCRTITEGSNTDVIEFDAASNSRVEEMRDIIEKVRYAPASSKYKVYIIDEVHMLSNSAFNALLKTLEEPPAHAVFILATTEPHKLPLTIISRCQRFDFKPITASDIVERMTHVLKDADIEADNSALKVIAQAASGGMRDALSMLDQVVSFSGDRVTAEEALLVTGSVGEDIFHQLAEALLTKDAGAALTLLNRLIAEGKDVSRLAENLITFFRDLLLLRTAPDLTDLLEVISGDERFVALAQAFEPDTLYAYIDILGETQQEMRFSNHAKVYIESALLKMVQTRGTAASVSSGTAASPELEQKIAALERIVGELQQQLANGGGHAAQAGEKAPAARKNSSNNARAYKIPTGKVHQVLSAATKQDIQVIREEWARMMQTMQRSHSALLEETEPVAASDSAFVLKFKYEIHCLMASENASLSSGLAEALRQQTGKAYDVVYVPEEGWLKVREDFIRKSGMSKQPSQTEENSGNNGEPSEVSGSEEPPAFLEGAELTQEDPIVSEAEKLFGKEFITVHDE